MNFNHSYRFHVGQLCCKNYQVTHSTLALCTAIVGRAQVTGSSQDELARLSLHNGAGLIYRDGSCPFVYWGCSSSMLESQLSRGDLPSLTGTMGSVLSLAVQVTY